VTTDYSYHMNGVDHKDRDTADWTVSLKSNRFYLRSFYWLFNGVLHHAMYTIIKVYGSDKEHPWNKYHSKEDGPYNFQMDLANDLISEGISMDWSDVDVEQDDNSTRPNYLRHQDFVPCGCMKCFFCKKGLTHGLDHKKEGKWRSLSVRPECPIKRARGTNNPQRCTLCHKNQRALNPL
jgi:hypothetical protein